MALRQCRASRDMWAKSARTHVHPRASASASAARTTYRPRGHCLAPRIAHRRRPRRRRTTPTIVTERTQQTQETLGGRLAKDKLGIFKFYLLNATKLRSRGEARARWAAASSAAPRKVLCGAGSCVARRASYIEAGERLYESGGGHRPLLGRCRRNDADVDVRSGGTLHCNGAVDGLVSVGALSVAPAHLARRWRPASGDEPAHPPDAGDAGTDRCRRRLGVVAGRKGSTLTLASAPALRTIALSWSRRMAIPPARLSRSMPQRLICGPSRRERGQLRPRGRPAPPQWRQPPLHGRQPPQQRPPRSRR